LKFNRKATAVLACMVLFFSLKSFAISFCNAPVGVTPPGTFPIASGGGSGTFTVTTGGAGFTSCRWGANSPGFISVLPGGGGGGDVFKFTVNFTVFANPDLAPRNASILITQSEDGTTATVPINQAASPGDFQLSPNPSSLAVTKGSSASTVLTITRSGGFTGTVFLSPGSLPNGVSVSFSPSAVTGSSSTMTISAAPGAPTGNFPLIINGTNGNVTHTTTVTAMIQPICGNEVCATMQTDGNFVVTGTGGNFLWSTGTSGTGAVIVRVQDDGNIVLYKEVWQAGTYVTPSPGPFPTQTCAIATLLHAPQTIMGGQCIVSPNNQYILYMSPSDGNFYIYNNATGSGTWGPGTSGHPGAFASLQLDGNFVVYDASNQPLWSSGTNGTGADLLNMENDGRIILYRPIWQSGTSRGWSTISVVHPVCDIGPGTGWTGVLGVGQCFVSPDGRYELSLQASGSLILQDNSVSPPQVLWQRP
jgi:hypothetical protein